MKLRYICRRNQEYKRSDEYKRTKKGISSNRKLSDVLFIFWAGGAALLSYSLVYALRKPFTAATFDGLDFLAWIIKP